MNEPPMVPNPLKPGDKVWFDGYGNGVVESVGPLRMWIQWEKTGSMAHDVSFARHLKPPQ